MNDTDLALHAGCGSYDGHQEIALRVLLARLTARRAAELYPDTSVSGSQRDYRLAVERYADEIEKAYVG